ncbi:MAG: deoxyribodipyrimidine photolyase [Clostridiales bacterium]|nr:MAG: deoxyribodipyrimidine photolyase [Clostridiales bacterium]
MDKNILWIRNDLRIKNNTALVKAVEDSLSNERELSIIFHMNPDQFKTGSYSHDYFFSALNKFYTYLLSIDVDIFFLYGDIEKSFNNFFDNFSDIKSIFINESERGYGGYRDTIVRNIAKKKGINFITLFDKHIHSAREVLKSDGSFYKVFTPYFNKWFYLDKPVEKEIDINKLKKVFRRLDAVGELNKFKDILKKRVTNFDNICGEKLALDKLKEFVTDKLYDYESKRDYPILDNTSHMSRFLTTGEISIKTVYSLINNEDDSKGKNTFIKELAWRDFYNMIYHANKNQKNLELNENYRNLDWKYNAEYFECWKAGRTGFPIVDAAMRQLKNTGFMHNRLRMVVASFLVKDLLIDWRKGEEYFSNMLIDYDSASNIGGWQWAASVGTDASPYFRVFNPTTQGKKFDKEGKFIREYVPELRSVSSKYIHEPNKYKEKIYKECGIKVGCDYPEPIVDHKMQRLKAIDMFRTYSI